MAGVAELTEQQSDTVEAESEAQSKLLTAVVWPSDAGASLDAHSLRHTVLWALDGALGNLSSAREALGRDVKAAEPWEFRPRAKLQEWLFEYFIQDGGQHRSAQAVAARLAHFTRLLRRVMTTELEKAGGVTQPAAEFVVSALLACLRDEHTDCLLRDADGSLREPERRLVPYDPDDALPRRLSRFDAEPWQLWDLRESCASWPAMRTQMLHCGATAPTAAEVVRAIKVLHTRKERLVDVLPSVWPSLGLLQQPDMRFWLRLECAHTVARDEPALLADGWRAPEVYEGVMRACRPEWFTG